MAQKQKKERTARTTVSLPPSLMERARDCVYWTPGLTLTSLIATAVERRVLDLEDANGGPFAPREGELPTGRPVGS